MTENHALPVKVDPQRRKRLELDVERLVLGLFQGEQAPLFERGDLGSEQLAAFARSEEVFDACFRFVRTLDDAWQARHPGQSLRVSKAARAASKKPETEMDTDEMDKEERPEPTPAPQPASRQPPAAARAPTPEPHATFFLPNAKVGVDYAAVIEGQDASGEPVRILDMRLPAELGLTFDPATAEVRGTPRSDGDHHLKVLWSQVAGTRHSGDCLLIVNPDPRSLWKVIEPPAAAPYPKPHADSQRVESASGLELIAASRRGRSHEHQGSFRDDDFFIQADVGAGWQLLSVADGAGSAQFSREGSRLAVTELATTLSAALAGEQGRQLTEQLAAWPTDAEQAAQSLGTAFHYLFHQAGKNAVQAIAREAEAQSAKARDYATTLLAAVVKPQDDGLFLASFWLGDGAIAVYGPPGTVRLMGTPDGGEFAGQTRFLDNAALADGGFAKRIGIGYFQAVESVLLLTDGVSDPRFETDNGLKDPTRWDALYQELAPILNAEAPERGLVDWLGFFSPGHHDDRTLALLRATPGPTPPA